MVILSEAVIKAMREGGEVDLGLLRSHEALRAEVQEQARLNGMGAERELALLTKLEKAKDLFNEIYWNESALAQPHHISMQAAEEGIKFLNQFNKHSQSLCLTCGTKFDSPNGSCKC